MLVKEPTIWLCLFWAFNSISGQFNTFLSSPLFRKAPRQPSSWAEHLPQCSRTFPSDRSSWRPKPRRSSNRSWSTSDSSSPLSARSRSRRKWTLQIHAKANHFRCERRAADVKQTLVLGCDQSWIHSSCHKTRVISHIKNIGDAKKH